MNLRVLVLASTSPRRRALLEEHGFPHRVAPPGIDDAQLLISPGTSPHLWTAALAYMKARAAAESLPHDPIVCSGTIILAADTVVVKEGRVLGQPKTTAEARATLRHLEQGSHTVITGVALIVGHSRSLFTDAASVRVGTLGAALIEPYVESGSWRGKAGAYNLAERLAEGWPITYEGDPATIMGLPMRRLAPILRRLLHPDSEHHA